MRPGVACWVLAICVILTGCQSSAVRSTLQPVTLTISAASDLGPAFREIGPLFEATTGIKTNFNFGSTGQLAQQIEKGAPADVFAAADAARVAALGSKGLVISDTVKGYAVGRIVLWTREDSPLRIERLEDVLQPEVQKIAIATPDHAPYGVAARQALQSAGIWEQVQDRLVLAENVQQALQYAQGGNVDVAVVAQSLAVQGGGRWTLIPADLHEPIVQVLAVISRTAHDREARSFADFVTGPQGREVLQKYGFTLPGQEQMQ
jgi:molybdate transport system substrate-binding protein